MPPWLSALWANLLAVLSSRELISAFLGAVFALVLAVSWDLVKEWRGRSEIEVRARRLLRQEVKVNIELLEGAEKYLTLKWSDWYEIGPGVAGGAHDLSFSPQCDTGALGEVTVSTIGDSARRITQVPSLPGGDRQGVGGPW